MTSPRSLSITKPDGSLKTAEELQRDAEQLVRDAKARADRIRAGLADNIVEATSKNQAASVTVTATGALRSVRFSERSKGMSPPQLSAAVMEAYQQASQQAAAQTIEITEREIGDERVTGMMRDLLPSYAEPDE